MFSRATSSWQLVACKLDYSVVRHPGKLWTNSSRVFTDSSVVLTEDTDSFIIGEKVWVSGTKPGTIAYIGETQFAPGEWAGIVLDQPIGECSVFSSYPLGYLFKKSGFLLLRLKVHDTLLNHFDWFISIFQNDMLCPLNMEFSATVLTLKPNTHFHVEKCFEALEVLQL